MFFIDLLYFVVIVIRGDPGMLFLADVDIGLQIFKLDIYETG